MYRSIRSMLLVIALSPAFSHAQTAKNQTPTISGKLLDADCRADDAKVECPVLPTSKAFGIQTPAGKYLTLDSRGNDNVLVALQRLRKKKGDILRAGVIQASVSGTLDGDTIKADSVELY